MKSIKTNLQTRFNAKQSNLMYRLVLSAFVFIPMLSVAQGVRVRSVSATIGLMPATDFSFTTAQLVKLSANAPFWQQQSLPMNNEESYYKPTGAMSRFAIEFTAKKPKNILAKHGTARIGIVTSNSRDFSYNTSDSKKFRLDTLISTTTGQTYYQDSIINTNTNFFIGHQSLGLEFASIFTTNDYKGFRLHGGLGIAYLTSVNASHTTSTYNYSSKSLGSETYSYGNVSSTSVTAPTAGGTSTSIISLPLGVDISLMKKANRAKGLSISYEAMPSLVSRTWREVDISGQALSFGQQLGLKLMF
jgi:hypothetical protein